MPLPLSPGQARPYLQAQILRHEHVRASRSLEHGLVGFARPERRRARETHRSRKLLPRRVRCDSRALGRRAAPPALVAQRRVPSGAYFATNTSELASASSTVSLASPAPNVAVTRRSTGHVAVAAGVRCDTRAEVGSWRHPRSWPRGECRPGRTSPRTRQSCPAPQARSRWLRPPRTSPCPKRAGHVAVAAGVRCDTRPESSRRHPRSWPRGECRPGAYFATNTS